MNKQAYEDTVGLVLSKRGYLLSAVNNAASGVYNRSVDFIANEINQEKAYRDKMMGRIDRRPGVAVPPKMKQHSRSELFAHSNHIDTKMNHMWQDAYRRQRELAKVPGLSENPQMQKMWDLAKQRQSRPTIPSSSLAYNSPINTPKYK